MNYKYEYEVLSDNAIDMIFNGKVSQKNAFDINVDFLSKIPNLIKPNQTEDSSWQKASASLDASAKIYGFRVDAVHSDTFKFLNGLNRNELNENEDIKNTTKAHKKLFSFQEIESIYRDKIFKPRKKPKDKVSSIKSERQFISIQ